MLTAKRYLFLRIIVDNGTAISGTAFSGYNFNGMVDGGNSDFFTNCVTTSTYCSNFWFRNQGATVIDYPVFSFPLTVRNARRSTLRYLDRAIGQRGALRMRVSPSVRIVDLDHNVGCVVLCVFRDAVVHARLASNVYHREYIDVWMPNDNVLLDESVVVDRLLVECYRNQQSGFVGPSCRGDSHCCAAWIDAVSRHALRDRRDVQTARQRHLPRTMLPQSYKPSPPHMFRARLS